MQRAPATSSLTAPPVPADSPARRLAVALGLSAVVHAAILSAPLWRLQPLAPTGSVIHVSLVPGHAEQPITPSLPPEPGQGPQPNAATAETTAPPAAMGADTPNLSEADAGAAETPSADDLHTIPLDSAYQLPEPPGPANWADLEYLVSTKDQGGATGRARYRYQVQDNSKYRLGYREEHAKQDATGDSERWLGEAVGKIGPDGLHPQSSNSPDGQPALRDSRLMSALFQFMHVPPGRPGTSGEMRIGDMAYRYEVIQLQGLETQSRGTLVTLQVRIQQLSVPARPIEVWLAVDYRYLPVRIRQIDAQGKITLLSIDRFSME